MQKKHNSIVLAMELHLFYINLSSPSAAYMRQWFGSALVQVRRQAIITWTSADLLLIGPLGTKLQWNCNQNTKLFIHENTLKNVVCQNGCHFVQGEMS